jgi:sugar-specific transcriptional regulator TrmB
MDVQILEDIGLTKAQAAAYKSLMDNGSLTAPALAKLIGESRTNGYKVLDKLIELGLAVKQPQGGKFCYAATSPTALEQFVQSQAERIRQKERQLNTELPQMLDYFFAHSERPSIRYFQGKEGLHQIFADMLQTGRDIYLLRSPDDVNFYDEAFFAEFRKKRALLGIATYALTVNVPSAIHDPELDFQNKFHRTWLPAAAYTAPVEWNIYGNKVALTSYGEEAMGIVIESPQIAESFRQVFQLAASSVAAKAAAPPERNEAETS